MNDGWNTYIHAYVQGMNSRRAGAIEYEIVMSVGRLCFSRLAMSMRAQDFSRPTKPFRVYANGRINLSHLAHKLCSFDTARELIFRTTGFCSI